MLPFQHSLKVIVYVVTKVLVLVLVASVIVNNITATEQDSSDHDLRSRTLGLAETLRGNLLIGDLGF